MAVTKVPLDALDADYEKASAIIKSGFHRGKCSRPQLGFVKGTLDRLYKATKAKPQAK